MSRIRTPGDLRFKTGRKPGKKSEPRQLFCIDCQAEFYAIVAKRCPACTKKAAAGYQQEYYKLHRSDYAHRAKMWKQKKQAAKGYVPKDDGYVAPPKTIWHPYQLQALREGKFIRVCNQVIRQECDLQPLGLQLEGVM